MIISQVCFAKPIGAKFEAEVEVKLEVDQFDQLLVFKRCVWSKSYHNNFASDSEVDFSHSVQRLTHPLPRNVTQKNLMEKKENLEKELYHL